MVIQMNLKILKVLFLELKLNLLTATITFIFLNPDRNFVTCRHTHCNQFHVTKSPKFSSRKNKKTKTRNTNGRA